MSDQPNGTLRAFDPEHIFANPYQHHSARRFHGEEFDALVEDIRVNGVHQPPPARPHPEVSGAVQLQMGHRRLAAWRAARPGEPFTVILKPLTDLEMLDGVIEENIHRTDLNDIERAQLIETYKQVRPDATNADLARVFRLKDPASISNIRKLLRLPDAIQQHVANNALPDAIARQLVGVAAVNPKAAQKIADEVAAAPKSEKQEVYQDLVRKQYWNKMVNLNGVDWANDWLSDAPVETPVDLGEGDHFVGACAGCVFHVGNNCARPACFDEKYKMWSAQEAARVAAKKGIAVAGPDEPTVAFIDETDYRSDERVRDILNARKAIKQVLRIAPKPYTERTSYGVRQQLDSRAVMLVTTDKNAVDAYFGELYSPVKARTHTVSTDTESDAERAKRIERERREMEAKRAARSTMWKSYYDGLWVMEHAALEIGAALTPLHRGPFVGFIALEFFRNHRAVLGAEPIETRFRSEFKTATDETQRRQWQLSLVALRVIAQEAVTVNFSAANNERETSYPKVKKVVEALCAGDNRDSAHPGFGVTLPDGWDVPPVHHTPFNCWFCGTFAGNTQEKLTGRDIKEDGWLDDGEQGVFCSQEHKDAYHDAQATETKSGKDKPQKRATGKRHSQRKRA